MPDQPPTNMKLVFNPDGSIGVPLKSDPPRVVTLPEPSMRQIGDMHDWIADADKAINEADAGDRPRLKYGEESPHGTTFIKIVEMLSGESVTRDELPAWACTWEACSLVLQHFTNPLGGEDADRLIGVLRSGQVG